MYIAPYWHRHRMNEAGEPDSDGMMTAFGWSFTSEAEARDHALQRAQNIRMRLSLRDELVEIDEDFERWRAATPKAVRDQVDWIGDFPCEYYGGARPVREPIEETHGDAAQPWALITRNRYGALVINTAKAMFVDIDLPAPPRDRRSIWQRLVLRMPPPKPVDPGPILARARQVVEQTPGMGMRLYRTAAGFRGLVTHRTYVPDSDEAMAQLKALGTDPLFVRLCKAQRCFRARITPKPWRIAMSAPPDNWFPYQTKPIRQQHWQQWLAEYQQRSVDTAVCEPLEHLGVPGVHPDVAPVLALHDERALGHGRLV